MFQTKHQLIHKLINRPFSVTEAFHFKFTCYLKCEFKTKSLPSQHSHKYRMYTFFVNFFSNFFSAGYSNYLAHCAHNVMKAQNSDIRCDIHVNGRHISMFVPDYTCSAESETNMENVHCLHILHFLASGSFGDCLTQYTPHKCSTHSFNCNTQG